MNSSETTNLLDQGLAAHGAGDFNKAYALFRQAVDVAPDNPEAHQLTGLMCELLGKRTDALDHIARAIKLDPAEPLFRINYAKILQAANRFNEALTHANIALSQRPGETLILSVRADIYAAKGELQQARNDLRAALDADPENIEALAKYGKLQLLFNNQEEALQIANIVYSRAPNSIPVLELCIRLAKDIEQGSGITGLRQAWENVANGDVQLVKELAALLFEIGYWDSAAEVLGRVINKEQHNFQTLLTYARYCTAAGQYGTSRDTLNTALQLDPESADALCSLARACLYAGELDAAKNYCFQALEKSPKHATTLLLLSELSPTSITEKQRKAMIEAASGPDTNSAEAAQLWLAIGDLYHHENSYENAFTAYQNGNKKSTAANESAGTIFSRKDHQSKLIRICQLTSKTSRPTSRASSEPRIIFIVGMPRSGTTLLETILNAHPDVHGAGELTTMPILLDKVLEWSEKNAVLDFQSIPADQLTQWRNFYIDNLPKNLSAPIIVDKQPLNFMAVSLIESLFPDARILHIRRNPIETGFSIFRQPFNREWPFTTRLEDIGYFFGGYAKLMAHWEAHEKHLVHLVQYETLLSDFEPTLNSISHHCKITVDPAMFDFHMIKRDVNTFSAAQVREPLRKSPTMHRDNYGQWLEPLRHELVKANVNLQTGAYAGPDAFQSLLHRN